MKVLGMNGDNAVAYAMKQINPDVVAGYPITPQTIAIEKFSEYVADGEVDTEFVATESEHSAMSACIGASAAGGRVMTSTASAGLAFMWEMLYIAASLRLPIVMNVMNRALSAPINIHCDHSDSMGARDSGWIQIHGENVQEGYDNIIQAVKIAESARLPVMPCFDGFIVSHAVERLEVLENEKVKKFVGSYKPEHSLLDVENPATFGPFDMYDYYMEHKMQEHEAMKKALKIVKDVGKEYEKISGRKYDILSEHRLDDADIALVALGSTAGTAREAVNEMRKKGVNAGLLKLRLFRPFPAEDIKNALKDMKAVAVLDRSDSFGAFGGPVFSELRSAMYKTRNMEIVNYIYGLGGRDITSEHIKKVISDMDGISKTGEVKEYVQYLGVR
ncbi:MAG: pyruvate ferredoxin oxidoreductase [Euryarchaeota archaeon CG01_land_8_20_14_3_00_38_12]|nr:MAG: pyruvate ferredoxin oxidoreductase [Euryarchaeota archaeon CG01_land_8_20_14_3_00_38_12]